MKGELYFVGVPIGNYDDLTFRAFNTLKIVDLIICEDTRKTQSLISNFLIQKNLISYVSNAANAYKKTLSLLQSGKNVAFVSDHGMPCISDPGSDFITYFRELNFNTKIIPGVSSLTTAFAWTGLKGGFNFHGFLPKNKTAVLKILNNLNTNENNIFFESCHRLKKTLEIFQNVFEGKTIYLARELTKTYEELLIGTALELIQKDIKGEVVLII